MVTALSLAPAEALPPVALWDKLEHGLAYALLALTGCTGFTSGRARWLILCGLAGFGGLLELAQTLAPGRDLSGFDWAANMTGIAVGYAIARVGDLFLQRWQVA